MALEQEEPQEEEQQGQEVEEVLGLPQDDPDRWERVPSDQQEEEHPLPPPRIRTGSTSASQRLNRDEGGGVVDWVLASKLRVPGKNRSSKSALSEITTFRVTGL